MTEPALPEPRGWRARLARAARLALFLLLGAGGGWGAAAVGVPLPWMIGPLLVTAALCISGLLPTKVPDRLRPFGQVVVASQVGLTFTPHTLDQLILLAPAIALTAVLTMLCLLLVSLVVARSGSMTLTQSFLSAVPTSPVEAAALAAERGIDPVPVIVSQTLRLSAVVLVMPLAIYALDGWPAGQVRPGAGVDFDPVNVLLLLACGWAALLVFRLLHVPNPNFLGPLAVTAALAVSGHGLPPFPLLVLGAAQIVLGSWLGSTFRREVLGSAGPLLRAALVSIVLLLLLCSGAAGAIAWAFGIDWRLVVLGAAPGGVSEMVVTAKYLGQDAAIVTAFHLARIALFMPNVPWMVALLIRFERWLAARRARP